MCRAGFSGENCMTSLGTIKVTGCVKMINKKGVQVASSRPKINVYDNVRGGLNVARAVAGADGCYTIEVPYSSTPMDFEASKGGQVQTVTVPSMLMAITLDFLLA